MYPTGDEELIQIVDAALADAARRAGAWLACRPGCHQCCTGVFRISGLDAERLRTGLHRLQRTEPLVAAEVFDRVQRARNSLATDFPGDTASGVLFDNEDAREAFEEFANEAVCPVLDPHTGTCSLYNWRPMTCRTFGPPVWTADGGFAVCELCFRGASADEVERSQVHLPPPAEEEALTRLTGANGETIVAFAFGSSSHLV